ncbi:hypothetical protein D4764_18G0011020 [Takifugu flavidus]|uniref:Uncharacterized protein n=1 Tax=Takifugu flavidus TaxID=433684 RepID=A0A5C6NTI9_9TELE|nr:hypothetical protein D4764_18G0011020 [Takifugu flavidus]
MPSLYRLRRNQPASRYTSAPSLLEDQITPAVSDEGVLGNQGKLWLLGVTNEPLLQRNVKAKRKRLLRFLG